MSHCVLGFPYCTKADQWSLGCILMELFTAKLAFDNSSVPRLLASQPLPPWGLEPG